MYILNNEREHKLNLVENLQQFLVRLGRQNGDHCGWRIDTVTIR